jgi:periplasmic protein TonB
MLEDSLFESRGGKRTRKPFTLVIAVVAHVVTIGVLVLIPLLETQALPLPTVNMPLWIPVPKLEPRSIDVFSHRPQAADQPQPEAQTMSPFSAPQAIPDKIATIDEPPRATVGFLPFSNTGNGINPFLSASEPTISGPGLAPPPPQPAPLPPVPSIKATPFRTGGQVQAANLIHQVNPVYPTLAKQTRTQGVVVMEAIISRDGSVESLRIVSGHPFLTQAAIDAVKQWKYRPTMLNGDPVDVITTITVTFTLQ